MKHTLARHEARSVMALASIFALRMLGLFMILPVFSLYAHQLQGYTPTLLGIALGIYGLTQALLQIPLGMSSDRLGRKPVITFGLLLFALGSVVAALSHTIIGVIIGRALQGAGAIGSTLIATIADLTTEKNRTAAMAMVGMSIGVTFAVAMVLGPVISSYSSLSGIFWLTSLLALCGIVILYTLVPTPEKSCVHEDAEPIPKLFASVLSHRELLRLDVGIFIQHAILTAMFIVLPIVLKQNLSLELAQQWRIYLPVLVLSFFMAVPFIIIAEKKQLMKQVFIAAIITIAASQLALSQTQHHSYALTISLFFFFAAFNLLEASLPSLISKVAPAHSKGTAMGVYSCSQFLGIFVGGALGGWLYGQHHITGVFYACAGLAVLWLSIALGMSPIRTPRSNPIIPVETL